MAHFALRLPDELYQRLKECAAAKRISVNEAIVAIAEERLRAERWEAALTRLREIRGRTAPVASGTAARLVREVRRERADRV